MQGYKRCKTREETKPKQKMINSLYKRQKDAHFMFLEIRYVMLVSQKIQNNEERENSKAR